MQLYIVTWKFDSSEDQLYSSEAFGKLGILAMCVRCTLHLAWSRSHNGRVLMLGTHSTLQLVTLKGVPGTSQTRRAGEGRTSL